MNNPATSMNSHSAGWNFILRDTIDPEAHFLTEESHWNAYDELYINHGVNFKPGSYNIIGGITPEVIQRVELLNTFSRRLVYSVDGFDFADFLAKRLPEKRCYQNIMPWKFPEKTQHVIGDSHSLSVWPGPDWSINRIDGKTLWGFLKMTKIAKTIWYNTGPCILYFGNIDVRFHLSRQRKPFLAAEKLIDDYMNYGVKVKATLTNLLPIEDESRKIPGTGLYKGKPFFGSQQLRQELSDYINEKMNSEYHETIKWPDYFKTKQGYMNIEIMEPKQSVHIRPKYYKRYANANTLF
jgi:hypothetical protein